VLISGSVKLDLRLCEDFGECFEEVLEGVFDDDLAKTFDDGLDEAFEDDFDEYFEAIECFLVELEASDAFSGGDWDVLHDFTQLSSTL
jgi:hypothetical protein